VEKHLRQATGRKPLRRTAAGRGVTAVCTGIALLLTLAACSTKKNTAGSRFWQSFTARYNTYFNGHEAYKEGLAAKEKGHQDNYTELLPYFIAGNEKSASLGKGNFETTITKCEKAIQLHSIKKKPVVSPNKRRTPEMKQYLARREFNPFLKNAWLLMGRAQFQKGDFLEAASTFSYITRLYQAEPDVANEARAWLARCYAAQNWFYDAEDILNKLNRDSIPRRVERERDITTADLLLRQERFDEALPYLRRTARRADSKLQKARLYFLLGQVEQQQGHYREAYKALGKCLRLSPPYQLAFNARILQSEVLSQSGGKAGSKQIISRLKRMARSDNNKEYLDQVYYAIGNIYLAQGDTAEAVAAYEQGRAKATRSGIEKGVLLLRLGAIYWDGQRYDKAQTCYTEALGLIDKSRKDYEEVMHRSKVLDKLVPFTSAVFLQDSLQALAALPEAERNAAIDRVIEALKQKEKEEEQARKDSAAQARRQENGETDGQPQRPASKPTAGQQQAWYFYNPMLVQQGKQDFRKRWGNRPNEDNWRRSNKTVVQMPGDNDGYDYAAEDSLQAVQDSLDALAEQADSVLAPEDDPHKREYYLKQIPFTEEQKTASDLLIMDGLYHAGLIEKDELEDFDLAAHTLTRIVRQYPSFDKLQDTYYQLFLLYSRQGRQREADRYRDLMAEQFPDSTTTRLILDPDYLFNARFGPQLEDSLYTATYDAYRRNDRETVAANFDLSTRKYPTGNNRPKFIFVHALSRIGRADGKDIARELRDLVSQYPKSDVSELAGMIVNGLEAGRQPGSGTYNLGSLWDRRTAAADSAADSTETPRLSPERRTRFVLLVAYPKDSLDDNKLLYDIAHFNFTGFYVRNFDIEKVLDYGTELVRDTASTAPDKRPAGKKSAPKAKRDDRPAIMQFRIHGFNSYDEVHAYAQSLYRDKALAPQLRRTHIYLISEKNLAMIGRQFSFNDYRTFFDKTFAPMKLNPDLPLDIEPGPVEQRYEDRMEPIYPLEVKQKPLQQPKDSISGDSVRTDLPEMQPEQDDEETYPADEETMPEETYPADEEQPARLPEKKEEKEETASPGKVNPLLPEKQKEELPAREETPAKEETDDNVPDRDEEESEADTDDGEWYPT